MGANSVGQVFPAFRASIHAVAEQAREKLFLPEDPRARHALHDAVIPAVLEEKHALFEAEAARQEAVDMHDAITVAFDGVLGREHPRASRTRWFWRHLRRRIERSIAHKGGTLRSRPGGAHGRHRSPFESPERNDESRQGSARHERAPGALGRYRAHREDVRT